MIDWSAYGRPEVLLPQVREYTNGKEKFWGWHEGMYIAGNDDTIALRLLNGDAYESVTRELWARLCRGASLVADVGAHSGIFTLDAFRAGAKRVLSVEPNPINFSRLVMNVRHLGHSPHGIFHGALSDENKIGLLLVKQQYYCHAAGRMGLSNPNGTQFPVLECRLDCLLPEPEWQKLQVIKIDAENFTLKVLGGMGEMLGRYRPDLILECTMPGMDKILEPLGYRFWRIWESGLNGGLEPCDDLEPYDPKRGYNGTDDDCRNRFASVKGLPDGD